MDKKDGFIFLVGIICIVVVAVVVQPMVTGEEPDLGIPYIPGVPGLGGERAPAPAPPPTPVPLGQITIPHPSTVDGAAPGERPEVVWDGTPIQLGYVDPSTYHLMRPDTHIPARRPIEFDDPVPELATYATFSGAGIGTSGTSLITEVFRIPFPRWELWYTIEPSLSPDSMARSDGTETYFASAFPRFTITVMDADDPGRTVRTISPGGIIDEQLWRDRDPRPWKEKFFEGGRNYYLIVERRLIDSYQIDIKVPVT